MGALAERRGHMPLGSLGLDRSPGVGGVRDAERALVAAGAGRHRAPPEAGWGDLVPTDQAGIVTLMAELSIRILRSARAAKTSKGVS